LTLLLTRCAFLGLGDEECFHCDDASKNSEITI
jgi:hypothetical protein